LVSRIALSRTSIAGAFRSTRFGASSAQNKRMSPRRNGKTWLMATCGFGSRPTPIRRAVGGRDSDYAIAFMDDLASRLANRVQLTSDGHKATSKRSSARSAWTSTTRCSSSCTAPLRKVSAATARQDCIGARKQRIEGDPDPRHVSTSYAERNNLNIRMHSRRMTRLTNAFSKKVENHAHAMALHFLYYNFVRVHKTLRMSPAMASQTVVTRFGHSSSSGG
jgi:hypothetical protein